MTLKFISYQWRTQIYLKLKGVIISAEVLETIQFVYSWYLQQAYSQSVKYRAILGSAVCVYFGVQIDQSSQFMYNIMQSV